MKKIGGGVDEGIIKKVSGKEGTRTSNYIRNRIKWEEAQSVECALNSKIP